MDDPTLLPSTPVRRGEAADHKGCIVLGLAKRLRRYTLPGDEAPTSEEEAEALRRTLAEEAACRKWTRAVQDQCGHLMYCMENRVLFGTPR